MNPFEKVSEDLIFEALIPGLEEFMPIVQAKDIDSKWIKNTKDDFKKQLKDEKEQIKKSIHVAKCPGINSIINTGWVVRTWQDIYIETFGDLSTFTWSSPADQKYLCPKVGDIVEYHSEEQFFKYRDNFPNNTLHTVLKICLPWQIIVPKNFNLLVLPVPYDDNNTFTTLPGIFKFGLAICNIQILWHVTKGRTLIPAGTPVAQYMLVPEEQPKAIVRQVENTLLRDVYSLQISNKFYTKYDPNIKVYK